MHFFLLFCVKNHKKTFIRNNHLYEKHMEGRSTDLVNGFRHSVPYINIHRDKTFVITLNGNAIADKNFTHIISDIGLLHSLGIRLVVVYGIRPQIDKKLLTRQYPAIYHKNIRVTDANTMELAKKISATLQWDITALLSMSLNNTPLQGAHINVVSGNFIIAQPLGIDKGVDYCHSGGIRRIDDIAINYQLERGSIVLIGPIAVSVTGESFNLATETIASQLAIKLKADKLIGFCSSQGISDKNGNILSQLSPNDAEIHIDELEKQHNNHSDILPFLRSATKACRQGVRRSHLISYQESGALLQELFSHKGIGTQIIMENSEQIRRANINDISGILELIQPLEQQGILICRSREQLEMEIDKYTIIERENLVIACAALYTYLEEKSGEMACLAVHPDYRNLSRGEKLLEHITLQAKNLKLEKLFVLTTQSTHWFQERGFLPAKVDMLPIKKQSLYNYQRCSKILILNIN